MCAFPDCSRPAAAPTAPGGRPPKYCDLPNHNRTTAFRARQAEAVREADQAGERAVSAASARLRQAVESLAPMLSTHREAVAAQMGAALEYLDDIGDPALVEAELGAVKADALREVSDARADAERARREAAAAAAGAERARADREEAVAARQAAEASEQEQRAVARDAVDAAASLREDLAAATQQLHAQRDELTAQVQAAQAERDAARAAADRAESGAQAARAEIQDLRRASMDAAAAAAAAQARADAAREALEQARSEARRIEEREVARADLEIQRMLQAFGQGTGPKDPAPVKPRTPRRTRGGGNAD
jgi:chromosome segregation ATPase